MIINDASKAPYHSLQLAFDMLAGFQAPRKRIASATSATIFKI